MIKRFVIQMQVPYLGSLISRIWQDLSDDDVDEVYAAGYGNRFDRACEARRVLIEHAKLSPVRVLPPMRVIRPDGNRAVHMFTSKQLEQLRSKA